MAVDVWILKFNHSLFQLSDWNLFSSLGLAIWAKFLTIVFLQIVLSVCSKIDLFQVYEQIYELLTNRHFRSRFALCSLWSVIFLFLLCVYCTLLAPPAPTPPPNFAYTIVFKSSWEDCIFPKGYENNSLCKICGVNRLHYGGFESSQREGGACAPVAPLRHYSPLQSHAAMGFFWPRTDDSSGVENTSLRACIRKTALWLKGFISFARYISFSSAKSAPLFDSHTRR